MTSTTCCSRLQAFSYGLKTFFKSISSILCSPQLLILFILYSGTGIAVGALNVTLRTYAITNPVFVLLMLSAYSIAGSILAFVFILGIAHKTSSLMKNKQSSLLTSLKNGICGLPQMLLLLLIVFIAIFLLSILSIGTMLLLRTFLLSVIIKIGKLPLIILGGTIFTLFVSILGSISLFIISAVGVSKCSLKDAFKSLKSTPYMLSQVFGAVTPGILFGAASTAALFKLGLLTNPHSTLYLTPISYFLGTVSVIACTVLYHRAKGLPTNKPCNRA